MPCNKNRKVDDEIIKKFINSYIFVLPTGSSNPERLTCSLTLVIIKSNNVNCHYDTR